MRLFLLSLAVVVVAAGCVDRAAEQKKKAAQQKAFFEAEAKAQAEEDRKEAQAALDAATSGCSGGDGAKCVELGRLQKDNDKAAAAASFDKGCHLKDADGCREAAALIDDGKKKLELFTSLCHLKDADGCVEGAKLADALVADHTLPEPKKLAARPAMQLLEQACVLGQAIACTARGVALVNDEPKGAVASFAKGCDAGEPTSCMQLGLMYKEGKGMRKKNEKKAAELLKKACDAGLKDACGG